MKSLIDLSHNMEQGMPVFPGTKNPEFASIAKIDKEGFREKQLKFSSHTGTHIDAPAHILKSGKYLDEFSLNHFVGNCIVLDLDLVNSKGKDYLNKVLHNHKSTEFILFRTGWSVNWCKKNYFEDFQVPENYLLKHLMQYNLKGIGFDTPSADPVDSDELPNHHTLLSNDMIIIENLTNLDQLPGHLFTLYCLPLKLTRADGSPVRAVAMV